MEKELSNYDRARELFEQAVLADPEHAPAYQAWALMEKELRNYDRARELFKRAALANPEHAPVYQAWALMEKELRNYDRARELFEQAVLADPEHAPAYQAWALMEKELSNYDRARELFEQAAQADPNNAFAYQAWALMEKELRNYDRARELFKRAALANPEHAPVYQAWALMEAIHGDDRTAQKILERGLKCVSKRQGQALILSTFGGLLARREDFALARQYFDEALNLDEANPLTHYHFAVDCLLPLGDEKVACQHLHRALQLRLRKERDRRKIQQALKQNCDKQL
jgi:tetratricopeptide (TPR) repeat protein